MRGRFLHWFSAVIRNTMIQIKNEQHWLFVSVLPAYMRVGCQVDLPYTQPVQYVVACCTELKNKLKVTESVQFTALFEVMLCSRNDMCVRVYVCVRARVCVCACVRVKSRWLKSQSKIVVETPPPQTSLNSLLVPTTGHHHPTLSPTVCSSVTPGET